ncbi:MAG TPA: GTPase Era [Firmicutes bacterium]|jgi:GTP-binding protein Era|nr:GTPase Era [Bacillota bacterium]
MNEYRSGFVGIIGRPNVGKSTLINALAGEKLLIVSPKPQTTRDRIRVIYTTDRMQLIFYDTPGIHKPLHKLGEQMNKTALNTLKLVDVILWLVDLTQPAGKGDAWVGEALKKSGQPVVIAFNKIDLAPAYTPEEFLARVDAPAWPWLKISALTGAGLPELLARLEAMVPAGPQYYPEEMITDRPESFLISEFIREAVLSFAEEEIPHSTAVVMEEMKERPTGKIYIRSTILVEKDSQKKIVIGRNGRLLKQIGQQARAQTEAFLGQPVYLDLWVKTRKDWRNSLPALREFGYWDQGSAD